MKTLSLSATLLLLTAICLPSLLPAGEKDSAVSSGPPGEVVRFTVDDPLLDRNGDGFQDVIVYKRKVHYDVDFDGRFDYTLTLKFQEYTTEGHRKYLGSSCDQEVFAELMEEGLDNLCQDERTKAAWMEKNFSAYSFYHDGYGLLSIFSDGPGNDGRIVDRKKKGTYDYIVIFNPDGGVKSVKRGSERVTAAEFDYGTNTSSGRKILLPKIEGPGDLDRIRAELDHLFPEG
jgi:hypothetical protein